VYETGSDSNGNFDIILSLEDGDNRFTLKVKDIAGNEGIKDFSVDFDASSSASIEIENVSGSIVELSVPSGIVIVEVFQNGDLIDKIDVLDNSASYNVTDLLSGITSKVSFVGIDAAGNRTKEVIYTKTNTLTIAGIILGGIIILILLLYLINLIIKGKIKIPGIKRTNSSQKSIEWYANHKEEIESVNVNNKSTKSEKGSRRMKKEY
ncbi:MAG TPA: hypothetical protein VGA67_04285, partial [Candidatus Dojkabacteria bacterium]